ncbi:MAG: NADH dehydrogenase (quinone) subunit D [Deltaproteobacteria bacterium]|nr:NADH dehydrogenase (quinone) subunit D [Deltaproteobacteria bacterium]
MNKPVSSNLVGIDGALGGIGQHIILPDPEGQEFVLNIGPSHPATHGTIRIIVKLEGEVVKEAEVEVGYLHRGFEKMCETVTYNQCMPYTDRLNYVSPLINNFGFCEAVEKLCGIDVPERCKFIRVLMAELSRVTDHLTCLGASAMELNAFSVMLYYMQAREIVYKLIEKVTGARLTISYGRVGGLAWDLPEDFTNEVLQAIPKIEELVKLGDDLLTGNRIFQLRMCGIAKVSSEQAKSFGFTGPLARASGVDIDIRRDFPYSGYENFEFKVPLGTQGDNFDRFQVRLEEVFESIKIIKQACRNMPDGEINASESKYLLPPKSETYSSIEGMIKHFELIMFGIKPPVGEIYHAVEGGNGEVGFYIVSDGSGKPYRCHCRSPSFVHMGAFKHMILGANLADVIPTFGMMNMIGGECDR